MKFPFLRKFGLALVCTTLFVACGDDNSKSSSDLDDEKDQGDVSDGEEDVVFENIKDLPKCSDSLSGAVYRVKDDHYSCFNDEWEKVSLFAKSICNIQECGKKTDGDFAYSKLNTTMYKCVADQWLDQDGKGFKESDYVDCYMDALVSATADKQSKLPECSSKKEHSISKVKDDYYVCLSEEWTKLADQVVSVGDLPECGKDESTVFVLGKMKAYVCKDGDWSCDGEIVARVVRDTIQVLDSAAANESVKVRGICMPSVPSAEKGEEVSWKFINLGGAPYTYAWTINGETSVEVEPKGSYTTGSIIGASLVLNEGFASESDEIVCSSLEIVATPVTGCECTASKSGTIDLAEGGIDSVTWNISGCSGAEPFIYKWSIGGYGDTKTISEYSNASYSPKVTVTNADGASMSVVCSTASFVKPYTATCNLSVEDGSLYVQANMNNYSESGYMTLYGPDDYSKRVYVYSYTNDYNHWEVREFNYVLYSSSSEVVIESSSSEEPVIESSSSVEEPVVESSSSSEEPVIESSSSSEEPEVESSSSSEEPVVESSSSSEEPTIESSSSVEEPEIESSSSSEEVVAVSSSSSEEVVESSSSEEYIPFNPDPESIVPVKPKPELVTDGKESYYVYKDIFDLEFDYYLMDGSDTVCHASTISCAPEIAVVSKNESVAWSISSLVEYEPTSYHWNFSDGRESAKAKPEMSYKNPGVIKASVTLDKGLKTETTVQCASLNVERDQILDCSCGKPELVSGSNDVSKGPVSYKWTVSGCSSNSPLSYDWSGFEKDSETSATGTFTSKGVFGASVKVSNTDGVSRNVQCKSVFVADSRSPVESITYRYGSSEKTVLGSGEYLLEECGGNTPSTLRLISESADCADVVKSDYVNVNAYNYSRCEANFNYVTAPIYIKVPNGMSVTIDNCH